MTSSNPYNKADRHYLQLLSQSFPTIADAAKDNKVVHQLIDLALLQNGMLRGEALDKFLKRSVELIG